MKGNFVEKFPSFIPKQSSNLFSNYSFFVSINNFSRPSTAHPLYSKSAYYSSSPSAASLAKSSSGFGGASLAKNTGSGATNSPGTLSKSYSGGANFSNSFTSGMPSPSSTIEPNIITMKGFTPPENRKER